MSKMLFGSIDLSKIDKSKIFNSEKGGKFLNVTIWVNNEVDSYGNIASVQQSTTKEEREKGVKATYIGNLKEYSKEGQAIQQASKTIDKTFEPEDSDLPF